MIDKEFKEIKDVRYRGTCWFCGSKMILDSDFNYDEVFGGEVDENDDGIVAFLHCPKCNAEAHFIIRLTEKE